ncbi:4Fe-4S binding protein [bacterium]|nr:4Fe-4S dicluster domain-containing protein [Candidatus Omnitrophota bacterium]MBU2527915.1 4Fe-4S binding protein [bacterium]MBU3929268.1 4Fe-4S binding protein [bacterium]MBU4122251.1 4Fe-4S binding protein [bacterium]
MKKPKYIENVATVKLNTEKCTGCGMCEIVCPHAVFIIKDGKAVISDLNACMECGACELNCPVGALSVKAGVGCAAGIINGILKGTEPSCDCDESGKGC